MIQLNGVKIRNILSEDKDILFNMINDETINKFTVGSANKVSYEEHLKWFSNIDKEKNRERYMIVYNGDTVGTLSLDNIDNDNSQVSLSIKLLNSRGKGIGTNAIRIILDYIFNEKKLNRVYANVLDYNISSQRMFEKNNFIQEGIKRKAAKKQGEYYNLIMYSMLKEDYDKKIGNR